MSEIGKIALSEVLKPPKVEASWSQFVPEITGANAPVEVPFNREAAILKAVEQRNK